MISTDSPYGRVLPALLWGVLLMCGCAVTPHRLSDDAETVRCLDVYATVDRAVAEAGLSDPGLHRMPGFPFLQSDRFLAEVGTLAQGDEAFQAWLEHLNTKAVMSLARSLRTSAVPGFAAGEAVERRLERCGRELIAALSREEHLRDEVLAAAQVPPAYSRWMRVPGLYPLTALPFQLAVVRDQARTRRQEEHFRDVLPVGPHRLYRIATQAAPTDPEPSDAVSSVLEQERDVLGIPILSDDLKERLLAQFAPLIAAPQGEHYDRIGKIGLSDGGPVVDTAEPVLYTWVDYGLFHDDITVRLNYAFWFPRRPTTGLGDFLLSGELDGLVWRVHLDHRLSILGWDVMHQCGCWYRFYPSEGMKADRQGALYREPVYVGLPLSSRPRKVLYLESASHHLLAVRDHDGQAGSETLVMLPYSRLKELTRSESGRGLADERGLVPESRRLERFVYWPMGVPSAGAMRVAGRHAIAFVGVRHFDDPRLLEDIDLRVVDP